MTILPLHVCCARLAIDPKTLRRWLALAHLEPQPDPLDARTRCLTLPQLTLLARQHARPLLALAPVSSPASPPSVPLPPPPPAACTPDPALRAELDALQARVTLLQEQVVSLTSALIRERDLRLQQLVGITQPLHPTPEAASSSVPSPHPPVASAPSPVPLKPLPRHLHPPVIPLIEVREDGSVVLMCPQKGILPLVPDTPEWFEWLASLPSFRFQGPQGRFGVQRKTIGGLPTREWRAYKHSHNRQHTFYLGMTETLTVAHLEQMAATITARLALL
jgi:hypothetical protein